MQEESVIGVIGFGHERQVSVNYQCRDYYSHSSYLFIYSKAHSTYSSH